MPETGGKQTGFTLEDEKREARNRIALRISVFVSLVINRNAKIIIDAIYNVYALHERLQRFCAHSRYF